MSKKSALWFTRHPVALNAGSDLWMSWHTHVAGGKWLHVCSYSNVHATGDYDDKRVREGLVEVHSTLWSRTETNPSG